MTAGAELWVCSQCGQSFVTRNLWHSCITFTEDEFFEGRPEQRRLYDALKAFVEEIGPFVVNVNKSRISFQGRVRFAGVPVKNRTGGLVVQFWLKRRVESDRFTKVELLEPSNWIYRFRITDPADLDDEVRDWLVESYRVGQQDYRVD